MTQPHKHVQRLRGDVIQQLERAGVVLTLTVALRVTFSFHTVSCPKQLDDTLLPAHTRFSIRHRSVCEWGGEDLQQRGSLCCAPPIRFYITELVKRRRCHMTRLFIS